MRNIHGQGTEMIEGFGGAISTEHGIISGGFGDDGSCIEGHG